MFDRQCDADEVRGGILPPTGTNIESAAAIANRFVGGRVQYLSWRFDAPDSTIVGVFQTGETEDGETNGKIGQ